MNRWERRTAAGCAVLAIVCSIALAGGKAFAFEAAPRILPAQGTLQAAFAPWDDVEGLLVDTIGAAREQILMQAYLLTSKKIAASLIAARQRGVDVRILADAAQSRIAAGKIGVLAAAGIPVWLETAYQNAHNKVIIIDAASPTAVVVTGSFNFTWAAQHANAENVLIVRNNPALAARYATNWQRHLLDATAYSPPP